MAVKPLIYKTLEGREVPYFPVSRRITAPIASRFPTTATPPTYKVPILGGEAGYEEFPHDEDSIKDKATPQEEKDAWQQYLFDKAVQDSRRSGEMVRVLLLEGVDLRLPDDNAWFKRQKRRGAEVPESPDTSKMEPEEAEEAEELHQDELFVYWLRTEVLKTDYDVNTLALAILNAQDGYLGLRDAASATFRGALGQSNGADAKATHDPDGSGGGQAEQVMVPQPAL